MEPGDYVEVECQREALRGVLMPTSEKQKDYTVIKLSSGYNIGIHKRNITTINLLEKKSSQEKTRETVEQNTKLPKIVILHTGGTIASKVDYHSGAVSAQFSPEELLKLFPELKEIANIDSKLVANLLSENMNFAHYNLLGEAIAREIEEGAEGIVITHGTDTLHYTSAALAFMLENLSVPVILVGAQRSSDRGSSDAASNLITAVAFAANAKFAGVAVCMHQSESDKTCSIIDGMHARKMHTSKRDAFASLNRPLLATVDYQSKNISYKKMPEKKSDDAFVLRPFNPKLVVGWCKIHPNLNDNELNLKHLDGLLLEGTGLGHAPIEASDEYNEENKKILKKITDHAKKIPVVMTSQCLSGRINLHVYSPGRILQDAGVLGHGTDILPEVAFIKLAWLLSNHPKQVAKLYPKNLRGEISKRSEQDAD